MEKNQKIVIVILVIFFILLGVYFLNNQFSNATSVTKPVNSSLYLKTLNGAAANVDNSKSINWTLSGYDANYTTALNNNGITLKPGVYTAQLLVDFGMPATGTGGSWLTIGFDIAGTNAALSRPNLQSTSIFNGWPTNNGTPYMYTTIVYVPNGGTIRPYISNAMGFSINVRSTVTLSQTVAF